MPEHLEPEASVSTDVAKRTCRRSADRQTAKYERARVEGQFLSLLVPGLADQFDGLDPLLLLLRTEQFEVVLARELADERFDMLHGRNRRPSAT